jgi:hypothetical protein
MSSWASYGVRAGPGVHEGDCRRAPLSMAVVAAASAVESRRGLCPARGWNAVSIIMAWLRLGWRTDVSGLHVISTLDVSEVGARVRRRLLRAASPPNGTPLRTATGTFTANMPQSCKDIRAPPPSPPHAQPG